MKVYHFNNGKTLRDGRPLPPIGEWLEHEGDIIPCECGLHGSVHPFDALEDAGGSQLDLCELDMDLKLCDSNKWVGRRRKRLCTINAHDILRAFARWCAITVVHQWSCPPNVMMWLNTADASLRKPSFEEALRYVRSTTDQVAKAAARSSLWSCAWGDDHCEAELCAYSASDWCSRAAAWAAADANANAIADSSDGLVDASEKAKKSAEAFMQSKVWKTAWSSAWLSAECIDDSQWRNSAKRRVKSGLWANSWWEAWKDMAEKQRTALKSLVYEAFSKGTK